MEGVDSKVVRVSLPPMAPLLIEWDLNFDKNTLFCERSETFLAALGSYRAAIARTLFAGDLFHPQEDLREQLSLLANRPDLSLHGIGPVHVWLCARPKGVDFVREEFTADIRLNKYGDWYLHCQPIHEWVRFGIGIVESDSGFAPRSAGQSMICATSCLRLADLAIEAMQLLKSIWSEEALLCSIIVRDIVFLTRPGFHSSSLPLTFGAIYLDGSIRDPVEMMLLIVHEAAHHKLIIECARDSLLVNPTDLAESPLRSEPRPLLRVLHATFVSWTLGSCLERLISLRGVGHEALARNREAVDLGLHSLNKTAILTERGERLLELMRNDHCRER